jgi:hypothetical protein
MNHDVVFVFTQNPYIQFHLNIFLFKNIINLKFYHKYKKNHVLWKSVRFKLIIKKSTLFKMKLNANT